MRIFANILLAAITAVLVFLSVFVTFETGLENFFGANSPEAGEKFFEFPPEDAVEILVETRYGKASFEQRENGVWWGRAPWTDRMDPRAAGALLQFTLGTQILELIDEDDIEPEKTGLDDDNSVWVRINRPDGHSLAVYRIGKDTPWVWQENEDALHNATCYANSTYYDKRGDIHVLTGSIRSPLFSPGFWKLRDHRPFLFHPSQPEQITINDDGREFVLERASDLDQWKIIRPLELRTDFSRTNSLVHGLHQLYALGVEDFDKSKLPTGDVATFKVSIKRFEEDEPITLTVYRDKKEDAPKTLLATVSDRPNALFHLPLQKGPDYRGLNELPVDINSLRARNLVDLDLSKLRSIRLTSLEMPEGLLISRSAPGKEAQYLLHSLEAQPAPLNEARLKTLLEGLTAESVSSFVSDAAIDLSRYNLHRPELHISLFHFDSDTPRNLAIARGSDGKFYATVTGSKRVVEISPSLYSKLVSKPYQWLSPRIFEFSAMDVSRVTIARAGEPDALDLHHDYLNQTWTAFLGQRKEDLTLDLNPNKANYLLNRLTGVRALNRFPAGHSGASRALASPTMSIRIVRDIVDEFGDKTGKSETTYLTIAKPFGSTNPAFYYAQVRGEAGYFSIDRQTWNDLDTKVLE